MGVGKGEQSNTAPQVHHLGASGTPAGFRTHGPLGAEGQPKGNAHCVEGGHLLVLTNVAKKEKNVPPCL